MSREPSVRRGPDTLRSRPFRACRRRAPFLRAVGKYRPAVRSRNPSGNRDTSLGGFAGLPAPSLWRNVVATLGVLPGAHPAGEIKPLVPVRIMPAQGSVVRPLAPRAVCQSRSLHERQRQVLRARRARGQRGRRAAAQLAQDPRRGLARRHPRADARDRAIRHARLLRRREESADRRLRHVRSLHRSRRDDRYPQGPAGAARASGSPIAAIPSRSTA